jgi:hypothetical protein
VLLLRCRSVGPAAGGGPLSVLGVAVAQNSDVVLVHSNDAVRLLSVVDGSVMQTVAAR